MRSVVGAEGHHLEGIVLRLLDEDRIKTDVLCDLRQPGEIPDVERGVGFTQPRIELPSGSNDSIFIAADRSPARRVRSGCETRQNAAAGTAQHFPIDEGDSDD